MLNAGGRPAASSTYDANSDRSESPISSLGDESTTNEPLSQIADEWQRNTTPRANNTSANDGSKREQMQRSGKRNNPFKISVRQQDNENVTSNEIEEEQISPRTSVMQSNTGGEVELGLKQAALKKVSFRSPDMDGSNTSLLSLSSIPEEEGADFQSEVTNDIRHRRSSSDDDFFCDEPLDRPPSSYHDKGDPLDLSQHSVPDYLASIDLSSAARKDPSASSKKRVGFKRKDSANFFLDDSSHADIEANPSCSPRPRERRPRRNFYYRSLKPNPNRVRWTAGGDKIQYPGTVSTPTAEMLTAKLLFNSVISTDNARFMGIDISDFYLNAGGGGRFAFQLIAPFVSR